LFFWGGEVFWVLLILGDVFVDDIFGWGGFECENYGLKIMFFGVRDWFLWFFLEVFFEVIWVMENLFLGWVLGCGIGV